MLLYRAASWRLIQALMGAKLKEGPVAHADDPEKLAQ
jgi:hypothetical protein